MVENTCLPSGTSEQPEATIFSAAILRRLSSLKRI